MSLFCDDCGTIHGGTCAEFSVWFPDDGEGEADGYTARGLNAEDATQNAAEHRDQEGGDGWSSSQRIGVRDGGRVRLFRVTATEAISYDAEEVST